MRVLVTGATGMLGSKVAIEAKNRDWRVDALSRKYLDIADSEAVFWRMVNDKPDVIINCAGVTPDRYQVNGEREMALANTYGPHLLASHGVRLIHMSTDCVFSGFMDDRYGHKSKEDQPTPDTLYGRTKLAGESMLPHVVNVRGSFVGWQSGLLGWLDNQIQHADHIRNIPGWANAHWNGTTVTQMASILCDLAADTYTGIVHVGSHQPVSKMFLLEELLKALKVPFVVSREEEPVVYRVLRPDIVVKRIDELILELVREYRELTDHRRNTGRPLSA